MTGINNLITSIEFDRDHEKRLWVELIDGEIVESPPPTPRHQQILGRLLSQLMTEAEGKQNGEWYPTINLRISPYSVLQPDLSYFDPTSIPGESPASVFECPLIVVEVLSDESRHRDTVRKLARYAERGIPEYWIVDQSARSMLMCDLDECGNDVDNTGQWDELEYRSFDGMQLDLDRIFAD